MCVEWVNGKNCTVKLLEWSSRPEKCYINKDSLPFVKAFVALLKGRICRPDLKKPSTWDSLVATL